MQELRFFLTRAWSILCPGARIWSSSWCPDLRSSCIQPLSCWPFVPGWPKGSQRSEGPAAVICSHGRPVAIAWENVSFSDSEVLEVLMVRLSKPTNPSLSIPDHNAVGFHYIDPSHVVKSLVLMGSLLFPLGKFKNAFKMRCRSHACVLL